MTGVLAAALAAHDAGLCTIKAESDGSKAPFGLWRKYQQERPPRNRVIGWFHNGQHQGYGTVCGAVSGNLEMVELEGRAVDEGILDALVEAADAAGLTELFDRIRNGYSERTPSGGIHWLYQCTEAVEHSQELARRPATPAELEANPAARVKVLIETRGEAGFSILQPSNGTTHPNGGAWVLISGGFDTIATVTAEEREAFLALCRTFDQCPEPAQAPRKPQQPRTATGDESRPGDEFNDTRTCAEVLTDAGFVFHHEDQSGQHFTRPGKPIKDGSSATVWAASRAGGERCTMFSSSIDAPAEYLGGHRANTPWQLHVALEHRGDMSAAASAWRADHPRAVDDLLSWIPQPDPADDDPTGETADDDPTDDPTSQPTDEPTGDRSDSAPPTLPEEFWQAREVHDHIRRAARARLVSPDALLGAVLARTCQHTDHRFVLPAIVGRVGSLNVLVALAGRSGGGKGSVLDESGELIGHTVDSSQFRTWSTGVGSGEGMVRAFFESAPDPDDKRRRIMVRRYESVLIRVDEGETIRRLAERSGQTTLEKFRQAFSGEALGETYADGRPGLAAHDYRLALIMAVQPELARFILDDHIGGTPQRFLWLSTGDPSAPGIDDRPAHPGPLDWQPPSFHAPGIGGRVQLVAGYRRALIGVDQAIADELVKARHAELVGTAKVAPLDAHAGLVRLKTAGLLAILDGRLDVTQEDWRLAGIVTATSRAVRCWLQAQITTLARRQDWAQNERHAERAGRVANATAAASAGVTRVAAVIGRHVHRHGGGEVCSRRCLTQAVQSSDRDQFAAALGHATAAGWVTETTGGWLPGGSKPA